MTGAFHFARYRRLLDAAVIAVVLLLAGLVAWRVLTPPGPAPLEATYFMRNEAMADVRAIAREPHPAGSAANQRVRDYLIGQMAALGLETEVQRVESVLPGGDVITIENLIGVLPGLDRESPAVAIMAHYDSTPRGPGAGDDAAGVAVALDAIRATGRQRETRKPQRDLMIVLTDGEELGLLGATAFFNDHPAADRIGFVVNLEARGSSGRAMMFETGGNNGATVRRFASSAIGPLSNSAMVFVYERMPNGTDFTVAREQGLQGLNFAFLGEPADYHAATDTPENLDLGSLEDMGRQASNIVEQTAFDPAPLPGPESDLAFSDVFGLGIIAYPPWAGWGILAMSTALLAFGAMRIRRTTSVKLRACSTGVGLWLAALLATALVLFGLDSLIAAAGVLRLAHLAMIESAAIALAGCVLAGALWLGRRLGAAGWIGAVAAGLLVGLITQVLAAVAAPVVHWPVLLGSLGVGLAGVHASAPARWRRWLLAGAMVCVVLLAGRIVLEPDLGWLGLLAMLGLTGLAAAGLVRIALAALAVTGAAFVLVLAHQTWLALLSPLAIAPWIWLGATLIWPLASPVRAPAR